MALPTTSAARRGGLLWGLVGVTAFSFTLPFTRVAVEQLSPLFVGAGRAVVAGVLAALALALTRSVFPRPKQWLRLLLVAGGVVLGFPVLTSTALTATSASHGAVVIALLPAATAVAAVLRTNERPSRAFWVFACLGAIAAVGFAAAQGTAGFALGRPDLLLFAAVVAAAVGYAEGGLLARELGAWQTVSWALVLALPIMTTMTVVAGIHQPPAADLPQWLAFAYLSCISMFLGFFAWYRGLALGPMAQVSQVQLVQPVMTITWAVLFLHESLTAPMVLGALAVIGCAAIATRTRSTSG